MLRSFVIFGAGGDLTGRYLLPALAELMAAGKLVEGLRILGVSQEDWTTEAFRRHVSGRLERHAAHLDRGLRAAFLSRIEYASADVSDPRQVARVLDHPRDPIVAYLALPPALFAPAIEGLVLASLPSGSRVVVEKPFGVDLESARALNRLLHRAFPEEAVFRLDHFLGKQTVQNILGLRFANRIFEPLWGHQHIERVDIVWDETLALEGRSSYYDRTGALRDMLQNHLLQLLCLVGMEPPLGIDARDLRDRKVEALRAVRLLAPEEVDRRTVRGRYGAGRIGDRPMPAYVDEEGIDARRGTETFAQAVLWIDNWRWSGVPFTLRTGKALRADRQEIVVRFKPVPHLAFVSGTFQPNRLVIRLQPDCMALHVNINGPGDPFELEPAAFEVELAPQDLSAYARLLLDVLEGNPTFTIRGDEAEESWRIVEPILEAWAKGASPLREYAAGSEGPDFPGP